MLVRLPSALASLFCLTIALATTPTAQVEARLSGTSALLGEGDTIGLVVGLRAGAPLASWTPATVPVQTQARLFGSVAGFRSGQDFYDDPDYAETGGVGYGRRSLLMAEAGLAIRAGVVQVSAGPSLRYRSESLARASLYNFEEDRYEATVISSERTDIGGVLELDVRLPVSETAAMGVHASLRRYDEGTQMAGLGLSASVAF
ncbi:MAG: hypothetical protein Rubg2KO_20640 [Rubricoccaceae bacterium]